MHAEALYLNVLRTRADDRTGRHTSDQKEVGAKNLLMFLDDVVKFRQSYSDEKVVKLKALPDFNVHVPNCHSSF